MLEKKLENKFKEHAFKYDMNDEKIAKKYYHSLRVKDFAKKIAEYEKLSSHEIKLAVIIGILHDYARFEQWKLYNTYSDVDSIDHGDLAVELLFDKGEINNFYNIESDFEKIKLAIMYHNKINVPSRISGDELMLCNIIRDADKLDIFNILIENKSFLIEDNNDISENVKKCFYSNKAINYSDLKSKSDKIILTLGLFYDINSKFSYDYINKNKIIEKLYNKVENKAKYKEYFEHINGYIVGKLDNLKVLLEKE